MRNYDAHEHIIIRFKIHCCEKFDDGREKMERTVVSAGERVGGLSTTVPFLGADIVVTRESRVESVADRTRVNT